MSWVRWSPESQLYIYDDVRGGITCCGCCIYDDFNCETEKEMAAHILEHVKARHLVPDRVVAMAKEIDPSLIFPKMSKVQKALKIARREIRVRISLAWLRFKTRKNRIDPNE